MRKVFKSNYIVTVIFIGLLTLPIIIEKNYSKSNEITNIPGSESMQYMEQAIQRHGYFLVDVTEESGVDFIHEPTDLDPKIKHIEPLISSTGAAVSVSDYNNDGWNDFYVTNSRQGSENALYRNERDGTFTNVARGMGVTGMNNYDDGVSMGSVWGDYDNDGYEDLFVYKWGKPVLFRNNQGENFIDMTNQAGLPEWVNSNSAIWMDYNNDGLLDLFLGGYFPEDLNLWDLSTTVIMPESYEYANNGGRNYLLKNNGDGTFKDVAADIGLNSTRWTLAAGALDINGNGYPDLIVANDYGVDELYINVDGKKFLESGKASGIGYSPKSGMNVTFGDVFNRGDFGIYISNITEMGVLLQGNNFWVPTSGGGSNPVKYKNEARKRGVYAGGWSYGVQFVDINNDGYQDLYIANGFISGTRGNSYWYDYSKISSGNKTIISNAKNWPDITGKSQSGYQQNIVWLNNGEGYFYETGMNISPQHAFDSRAVAYVDLWNRGSLDILVANQNNRMIVYKNNTTDKNNWLAFDLSGTVSNRSSIGSIVKLYWDGKVQSQIVSGGIGFSSQNQRQVHFGIGEVVQIEKVIISWPSGKVTEIIDPQVNMLHNVIEPS